MKYRIVTMALALGVFACGPSYELLQNDQGQTIRINKKTGEVSVMRGGEFVAVKDQSQIQSETEALSFAKTWPFDAKTTTFSRYGIEEITITSKWISDRLHYRVNVSPWPESFERARRSYTATGPTLMPSFNDSDSFERVAIELSASEATRIVNNEGEPIGAQWEGSTPCSAENYRAVSYVSVGWKGFD